VRGTRLAPVLTITTKSPYAVRALVELARRGEGEPVPIGEIAKAREIPVQFLEGLFATLRRAGILQSQRGVKGGYLFARPPAEVTVLEVTELLDGELGSGPGATDQVWTEATGALKSVLRSTSIADLAEREAETNSPMYYI
jgi:Rrf2 family transcriptional regulator, cysteine metabolism repressor